MATVIALARDAGHHFSKQSKPRIQLAAGLGVVGDAHISRTVQHLSRVRQDPTQPNLRQAHLIHGELLDTLNARGFPVPPGALGENITTRGIALLDLSRGARLTIGEVALEVTGLRNPCAQIERYRPGLLAEVVGRDADGQVIRKCGVMAIVLTGGTIALGDPIGVEPPRGPFRPLEVV